MKFSDYLNDINENRGITEGFSKDDKDEIRRHVQALAKKYGLKAIVEFGDDTRLGYCNLAVLRAKGLEVGSYEFEFDTKGKLDIVARFNPYGQGNFLRGTFRDMALIKDLQKSVKALGEFTDDALKLAKETEKYLGEF